MFHLIPQLFILAATKSLACHDIQEGHLMNLFRIPALHCVSRNSASININLRKKIQDRQL